MRYRHDVCLLTNIKSVLLAMAIFSLALFLAACTEDGGMESTLPVPPVPPMPPVPLASEPVDLRVPIAPSQVLVPTTGNEYLSQRGATIDTSNKADGYVMVRYTGGTARGVIVLVEREVRYVYDLDISGNWEVFPLTMGSGEYRISVLENVGGRNFAMLASVTTNVTLRDERLPFLHPNQLVNFNSESKVVELAESLAQGARNDHDVITSIFEFVIDNIEYDFDFARAVSEGIITSHIPDVDATLASGRGICFDYASLMAAMLRAQKIPTRLEIGYVSGTVYHAWVSVYICDVGWILAISYDGTKWTRYDPTFSAGSNGAAAAFIGDGTNYNTMFKH